MKIKKLILIKKWLEVFVAFILLLVITSWLLSNLNKVYGVTAGNITNDCNEIRAIYLALLLREPDVSGFQTFCQAYKGGMKRSEIIQSIMSSEEFKARQ